MDKRTSITILASAFLLGIFIFAGLVYSRQTKNTVTSNEVNEENTEEILTKEESVVVPENSKKLESYKKEIITNEEIEKTEGSVVLSDEVNNPSDNIFEVLQIKQTVFESTDDYYGCGGYEIEINVSAKEHDIFIPKTTSDSTKTITGFVYSIKGDTFNGSSNSKISCSKSTQINKEEFCKISAGDSSVVTATVWLTANNPGIHGIKFETLNFLSGENKEQNSFTINKETQNIYIQ